MDTGIAFEKSSLKKIFGDFVNVESNSKKANDNSIFGTILAKQLVELMGGELIAESPSGLSGNRGLRISFTLPTYSNDRSIKDLDVSRIKTFQDIKTLVITGSQNRDEEVLSDLHKIGLSVKITTYQKTTINQIKANLNFPDDRYDLIVIVDEDDLNGFEPIAGIWENNLSGGFIVMLITSDDKRGNFLKCITMGVDHYLIKPFDISELVDAIKSSFHYIEEKSSGSEKEGIKSDLKILIVEDNLMNQKVIGTMLKTLGYSFEIANDGNEGLIKATKKSYDLIIMDLIMPEMDGFEAARRILEHDKELLIVGFSADNMPESRRKAELSGIKDFITKPVRLEELKRLFAKYFKN
jgi:CheY-like chemotaxis protein